MLEQRRLVALLALFAITLAACGGTDDGESTAPPTSGPAPAPSAAPSPAPSPSPAPAPAPAPSPAPAPVASATLQWSSPGDPRVQGYRVYYGTQSGQYAQPKGAGLSTSGTSYTVGNLTAGRTYHFAVTAYDAAGNESDYSSEVTKVVN